MDEFVRILIGALINGAMLAVGMVIGSKLTSRSMIKEVDKWLEKSELFQLLKKTLTDQTLIEKATKFFDAGYELASSPEAKNFFKNVTVLMKDLGGEAPQVKLKLPERKKSS